MKKVIGSLILLLVLVLVGCNGENSGYTISFNTLGGSEVDDIIVFKSDTFELPDNPSKEGYHFDGWYRDSDFSVLFDTTQVLSSDISLYAKWDVNDIQKITYHLDGGTFGNNMSYPESCETEKTYSVADPKKEGYIFRGWHYDSEFSSKYLYHHTCSGPITLYAKWEENKYFSIAYELDGGEKGNNPDGFFGGTKIVLEDPTREGYIFKGWYHRPDYSIPFKDTVKFNSSITLYAKWIPDTAPNPIEYENLRCVDEQLTDLKYGNDFLIGFNESKDIVVYSFSDETYKRTIYTGISELTDIEKIMFDLKNGLIVVVVNYDENKRIISAYKLDDPEYSYIKMEENLEYVGKYLYIYEDTIIIKFSSHLNSWLPPRRSSQDIEERMHISIFDLVDPSNDRIITTESVIQLPNKQEESIGDTDLSNFHNEYIFMLDADYNEYGGKLHIFKADDSSYYRSYINVPVWSNDGNEYFHHEAIGDYFYIEKINDSNEIVLTIYNFTDDSYYREFDILGEYSKTNRYIVSNGYLYITKKTAVNQITLSKYKFDDTDFYEEEIIYTTIDETYLRYSNHVILGLNQDSSQLIVDIYNKLDLSIITSIDLSEAGYTVNDSHKTYISSEDYIILITHALINCLYYDCDHQVQVYVYQLSNGEYLGSVYGDIYKGSEFYSTKVGFCEGYLVFSNINDNNYSGEVLIYDISNNSLVEKEHFVGNDMDDMVGAGMKIVGDYIVFSDAYNSIYIYYMFNQ